MARGVEKLAVLGREILPTAVFGGCFQVARLRASSATLAGEKAERDVAVNELRARVASAEEKVGGAFNQSGTPLQTRGGSRRRLHSHQLQYISCPSVSMFTYLGLLRGSQCSSFVCVQGVALHRFSMQHHICVLCQLNADMLTSCCCSTGVISSRCD